MKVPRRARSKPRRSRATLTATAALVLEPRVRHFAGRSYIGAALGVALLALGALLAVRELAVIEPMLAAEGAHAARAVVYELPVGAELHIPIEPSSDVLRFVVHAYGRPDLALTPHPARIQLDARGDRGSRSEELRADLPGLRSRVTPEDAALQVGDPVPFEVDVHDLGVGELVVKITAIDGAAGLLVRAYRREQLTEAEGIIREAALDRPKKDDVARWTWELGWDELTAAERVAVLRARWHKVGALRGLAQDLRSITVAIAPATPREVVARREDLLGRIPLRGDERIAILVHVGTKVRFVSDEATMLRAAVRDANAAVQNLDGRGQLEVGPFDTLRSVEVSAARDVALEVRASDAGSVEWLGWANTWRTTPSQPVIVDSADDDRIVRVSLRRAMARQDMNVAHLTAHVELTGGGLARPLAETFRADRPRSRVDRYEDFDSLEAPSERVFFFLALPRGTTARVTPGDTGSLDVSRHLPSSSRRRRTRAARSSPAGLPTRRRSRPTRERSCGPRAGSRLHRRRRRRPPSRSRTHGTPASIASNVRGATTMASRSRSRSRPTRVDRSMCPSSLPSTNRRRSRSASSAIPPSRCALRCTRDGRCRVRWRSDRKTCGPRS